LDSDRTPAEAVLDLARFAPSGDNAQPWRFTLRSGEAFDVHAYDTRDTCVYDLDGWASEVAHGILLETIAIAATRFGCRAVVDAASAPTARPASYRVALVHDEASVPDPLAEAIVERSVQRFALSTRPLEPAMRAALEEAAAPYRVRWFDSWRARARVAHLALRNARIRMTIREAYDVHRAVIAWHATTSEDRMPDASLGANAMLLASMRKAMTSFERVDRMNRLTGTFVPRFMLDYLPGVRCSASLALVAHAMPQTTGERVAAGRAVQRLWLTATRLGLQMQPQYTPLVFARYAREGRAFTTSSRAAQWAREVAHELDDVMRGDAARTVWLARIGHAGPLRGRSLRLPLSRLVVEQAPASLPPPP
jgi:nitroreductase